LRFGCITTRQNRVVCWGRNASGQLARRPAFLRPTVVFGERRFRSLNIDGEICGITLDGQTECIGERLFGGATSYGWRAIEVPELVELEGYAEVTCGRDIQGGVHCWGVNDNGGLASPDASIRGPLQVPLPAPAIDVTVSGSGLCALTESHEVHCWGGRYSGNTVAIDTPPEVGSVIRLPAGAEFDSIEIGTSLLCATVGLEIYCNRIGFSRFESLYVPSRLSTQVEIDEVEAGYGGACGMDINQVAHCWTDGDFGRFLLGPDYDDMGRYRNPMPVTGEPRFVELALGKGFACGIAPESKRTRCWGTNLSRWHTGGQLGVGDLEERDIPTDVLSTVEFESIDAGEDRVCGLDSEGRAYCWGQNRDGLLAPNGPLLVLSRDAE